VKYPLANVQINVYIMHMTDMHIADIHFNQLRLVEALDRSGNLGVAADNIGLTQSAASHALARLRRIVRDPIFVRTADGMRPTPYGERLAAQVRDALQSIRAGLAQSLDFTPSQSTRTFSVIMSDVSQFLYLPALVSSFSISAPSVGLRVHPMPPRQAQLLLESGEVDLAVGAFNNLIAGCRQRRLYSERYVCVTRRDHPNFRRGMTLKAFCDTPHAIVDPAGHIHEELDTWLTQQKAVRRQKLHVPYFLALPNVIAASDVVVLMAERLASEFAKTTQLELLIPPVKLPNYNVSLFWHERFDRDPANRWIRDEYIRLFGERNSER
jgi:DNA-binding transcriptional LysR family regulator